MKIIDMDTERQCRSKSASRTSNARSIITDNIDFWDGGQDTGAFVLISTGERMDSRSFKKKWLAAAITADRVYESAKQSNRKFRERMERCEILPLTSFEENAKTLLFMLRADNTAFVDIGCCLAEILAVMAQIGFLKLNGDCYCLCMPIELNKAIVRSAHLKLTATMDEYFFHPENIFEVAAIRIYKSVGK